ncbi:MAG: hypothetical protein ACR2PL_20720 [Dehalococcoidia bacterium]
MRLSKMAGAVSVVLAMSTLLLAGCSKGSNTGAAAPAQSPAAAQSSPASAGGVENAAAAEKNPSGDIPDTQAFVPYRSTEGGYQLDVPEGWARTTNGAGVRFTAKLDGAAVTLSNAAAAPTAASARSNEVAALQRSARAVQVTKIQDVQLPAGSSVLVEYSSNSEPDPVTGKQVRLENNSYLFFKNGKLATLQLWAPLGADNVDQWQRMAHSFGWF